jgi:hypothetical protein
MKKILLVSTLLLVFCLTTRIASARVFFGFVPPWLPVVFGPPVSYSAATCLLPLSLRLLWSRLLWILWLSGMGPRLPGFWMD